MRDDKTSIEVDRLQNAVTGLNIELGQYRRALEEARETLHDKYVMAVITGLIANGDYSLESIPHEARKVADTAMKARKA